MAVEKIICKKCNKSVLAVINDNSDLTAEQKKAIDAIKDTPCSRCVSPKEYAKQLIAKNKKK